MSNLEKSQKESWLEEFQKERTDLFFPEAWGDEKRQRAAELVRPSKVKSNMFTAIPMKCYGPKCVYANQCPLQQQNLAPVGDKCPIELTLVVEAMNGYMRDLNVDENNMVEVSMVRDLVNQEVQMQRATWTLSNEHFVKDNIVGVDNEGHPLFRKELNLAVEFEDKIHRRRRELRKELLATREARAKMGMGELDTAQALSNIYEKMREIDINNEKLLQKQLGTYEKDTYIDVDPIDDEGA